MKTAYIIDSSSSINETLGNRSDVYVQNLEVTWGDAAYTDTTDLCLMKEFYQRLESTEELPKTSQPRQGKLSESFEDIVQKGYDSVIIITLASAISGTYNTFRMISEHYQKSLDIRIIDSKGTSYVEERLLEYAIELNKAGFDLDTIEEKLNWFSEQAKIYVVIEDLNAIVKGGRLSSFGAFLGSTLKIRPILHFDDEGKVEVFEKVRTTKKVYQRYLTLVDEAVAKYPDGIDLALAHGDCEDSALEVKELILEKYPEMSFRVGYLTPVLGTHGGKNSLGIGILPKLPK
ncbi:DegV family protein [Ruoffia tabacinasalis]|nr:DegV family protein [Ruoffia tabacinasalis]